MDKDETSQSSQTVAFYKNYYKIGMGNITDSRKLKASKKEEI